MAPLLQSLFVLFSVVAFSTAAPQPIIPTYPTDVTDTPTTTAVTPSDTDTPTETETPESPKCATACDLKIWPNGGCASVNDRATCTTFDPFPSTPHNGQTFCMCQAGYRGDGLPPDSVEQYRVKWVNERGDQTHRVFVKPGQTCNTLCDETGANTCSEVPLRDVTDVCEKPDTPPDDPRTDCVAACDLNKDWPNGGCASVDERVTCTTFNPLINTPNKGKTFCMCQAGYRGDGLPPNGVDQYRVSWVNDLGDQTHRVFVKPGQTCNTLCDMTGANTCSEVPLRDACL